MGHFLNWRIGLAGDPVVDLNYSPFQWYETRFDGNGAEPDGTDITIVGGGNPDVTNWDDINEITTTRNATGVATRYPHWTPSVFKDGTVAGVDFSVNGDTSGRMTFTEYSTGGSNNERNIFIFALKGVDEGSGQWITVKNSGDASLDGISNAGNGCYLEQGDGGFQQIGENALTKAQQSAEPFIIMIESRDNEGGSTEWYYYYANTTDTNGVLTDGSMSGGTVVNSFIDFLSIGTGADIAGSRTDFILGAWLFFSDLPPENYLDDPSWNPSTTDDITQNIFQYVKYHYLNTS
jgi:hypothetical protein